MGSCGAPTQRPAPCTQWRIAGSDTVVSESCFSDGGAATFYATPSLVRSGNGALIAWTTSYPSSSSCTATDGGSTPIFWGTRALNMDGTPRSGIVSHSPFPVMAENGYMSLAATPQCAFGGLADSSRLADGNGDPGCSFVSLDGDGNEIGPVVVEFGPSAADASLPPAGNSTSGYCIDLGPAPDGFSYLHQAPDIGATGTGDLVTVGSNGSLRLQAPLGTFPAFNPRRLVLDDESFLLISFVETDAANIYTWTVAHHDASGVQIAPGTTVATSEYFVMAETSSGVLAAYGDLNVVPLSRDGVPTATPVALPVTGLLFSFALDPSPSGDVILHWTNYPERPAPANGYHSFAMELDPAGRQRGPVLDFGTLYGAGEGSVLVSADGERALVVYSSSDGVHTLPLACAAH